MTTSYQTTSSYQTTISTSSDSEIVRIGNTDWCLCGRCVPMGTYIESLSGKEPKKFLRNILMVAINFMDIWLTLLLLQNLFL